MPNHSANKAPSVKENTDWRDFAERLTALARSEGQDDFLDQAFLFLNELNIARLIAVNISPRPN